MKEAPLLVSPATAIKFGFPVLNKVLKVFFGKILVKRYKTNDCQE